MVIQRFRGTLVTLGFCALASAPVTAASHVRQKVSQPSPAQAFEAATRLFWQVEPRFNNYYNPITELPPLEASSPNIARYRAAAHAAQAFLSAADLVKLPTTDVRRPVALYFAAMAYSSLGEHEQAIAFLTRLLNDYPNYRRPRVPGFSEYDRPVRGSLLHLRLYHASLLTDFSAIKKPLEFLGTIAASGADALSASGAADPGSDFGLSYAEPTPDQLRVAALPTPQYLVAQIHNKLLPVAIKTSGARPVREYLRGLTKGSGPFASYAAFKLISIDREIVAQYQAEAKKAWGAKNWGAARAAYALLMGEYAGTDVERQARDDLRQMALAQYKDEAAIAFAAKNFEAAKGAYRRVMAEYADTDDATWAEGELKKVVPVAVAFYKAEGTKNYHPEQQGVAQSKGREFFEKMYREDPAGPQASFALYYWSRALGTEGKVKQAVSQLKELLVKFPESDEAAKVLYLLGFYHTSKRIADYGTALQYLAQVPQKYPNSPEAPEALWLSAFILRYNQKKYADAIVCLEQLKKQYPQSPRWKFVEEGIQECRQAQ